MDSEERLAATKAVFESSREDEMTQILHRYVLKKERETMEMCNSYYQVPYIN